VLNGFGHDPWNNSRAILKTFSTFSSWIWRAAYIVFRAAAGAFKALTVSVFVGTSLDGFIARANGELAFLPPGGGEPHGYN
jgi:hypothetical protein